VLKEKTEGKKGEYLENRTTDIGERRPGEEHDDHDSLCRVLHGGVHKRGGSYRAGRKDRRTREGGGTLTAEKSLYGGTSKEGRGGRGGLLGGKSKKRVLSSGTGSEFQGGRDGFRCRKKERGTGVVPGILFLNSWKTLEGRYTCWTPVYWKT